MKKFLVFLTLILSCSFVKAQFKYYESTFAGGVTCGGWSPTYSGAGTGNFVINIAPGSTIRKAFLIASRLGAAANCTVTLNGTNFTFNNTNQVTGPFNTLYGGASGVHVIDVTVNINPSVNNYSLTVPNQSSTSNRYQDWYLYVAYDNNTLPPVSSVLWLNTFNLSVNNNTWNLTVAQPINNTNPVCLSFFNSYQCNNSGDAEKITVNGTVLGLTGLNDINSGFCGGTLGNFYYRNCVLTGLSDDNPNQTVNQGDALSDIKALIANNATNFTVRFDHNGGGSDNHQFLICAVYSNTCTSCVKPTLSTTQTNVACNGGNNGSSTVSASGGISPYTYLWSSSLGSAATATGMSAGVYTVTVTEAGGCSETITVNITQPTAVAAGISTTTSVSCNGGSDGSATATANGGTGAITYTWNNSQVGATATGLSAGTYTVTAKDANGCTKTASITITQPTAVVAGINNTSNVSCNGGNNGVVMCTASGGTGAFTYAWNNGQTAANATGLTAGNYTCVISDGNGCTATATATITEPAVLVATATGANACVNASANGSAAGGTANYNYAWSNGQNTQNITGLSSGTYTLTVTDANNCTATATVMITASPAPVVLFSVDDSAGCAALCVNLTCNTANIASYTWTFGDGSANGNGQTANHCYKNAGTYSVTLSVTDNNGCTGTLTKNNYINVYPNVVAAFVASPQPTTILNPLIKFTDQSLNGAISWNWTFGDLLNSTSTQQNPTFNYKDSGCYNVQLIADNQYNCPDTTEQVICINGDYELFAPNAFTPDGNGLNDIWNVSGIGIDPNHFELYIFDRWGDLIFKTTDLFQGWNGKANGGKDIAQQDVYVWKVLTRDFQGAKHSYIGHVSLVR